MEPAGIVNILVNVDVDLDGLVQPVAIVKYYQGVLMDTVPSHWNVNATLDSLESCAKTVST